jgi:hypothetical protein
MFKMIVHFLDRDGIPDGIPKSQMPNSLFSPFISQLSHFRVIKCICGILANLFIFFLLKVLSSEN